MRAETAEPIVGLKGGSVSDLSESLRSALVDEGATLVGYADLTELPEDGRHGMPRGVSIARALDPEIIASIRTGPNKAYRALYDSANEFLTGLSHFCAERIEEAGYKAVPRDATHQDVDWETASTKLPHKTVATRAGLGWIGKCALLITGEYGAAVRLTSVYTDAPLEVGDAVNESKCGDCVECHDICPGNAVSGINWAVGMTREDFFDAFACRDAARDHAPEPDVTICGRCIPACPRTLGYLKRVGAI